jgi:putative AlgH/UPF0301 family transcriptional regulator
MLLAGIAVGAWRLSVASPRCSKRVKLYALPEKEVPVTNELPRDSDFFSSVFKRQHGASAAHGSPWQRPVSSASEFAPTSEEEPHIHEAADLPPSDARVAITPEGRDVRPAAELAGARESAVQNASVGVGALLIGSPNGWGDEQSYFNNAAVLLVKKCGWPWRRSVRSGAMFGVFLNYRTQVTMGEASCPARFSEFNDNPVYSGGAVGPYWTVVHNHPVIGATNPIRDVYVGGNLAHADTLVKLGKAKASDTMFFQGYTAWPMEQLQDEVDAGKWTVVSAPTSTLLQLARETTGVDYVERVREALRAREPL